MKLVQLIQDLTLNDDSIVDDGFTVRDIIASDQLVIAYLIDLVKNANLKQGQETAQRHQALYILRRVYQRKPELGTVLVSPLEAHIKKLRK